MAMGIFGNLVSSCQGLDGKMETLRRKTEALRCRADDVNEELKYGELRSGKKRKSEVENWLINVRRKRNEVESIEQEAREGNLPSVLLLGNRIDKLIGEVAELNEQATFPGGLLLDVREAGREPLLAPKLTGQAFEQNLEKIWAFSMDDEVLRIGIYGMGGVGKTTLVSHIYNRLVKEPDLVGYWITASQDCSICKLQNDIAKTLKFDFANTEDERKRAAELSESLKRRKNCVLILDDVWKPIPLERVGIPPGSKLIITTRSSDVCRGMVCQENIKVEPLSKGEAWSLFRETLGQHTELSPGVRDIAMSVAAKCSGLPLGIITMAGGMRGLDDIHEWRNVLGELRELTMGQENMEDEVFPILKYSYSRLNDEALQSCFLHCAFYPEDFRKDRNELVRFFIAEGLIKERKSRLEKFDKGRTMLNKLERACLLERCKDYAYDSRYLKMHDLIRDMALKILTESNLRFMVKAGVGLREIPDEGEWTEHLEKISLMENQIQEIPRGFSPRCPRLSTLILKNNPLERIADSFFEHTPALKVLDLSYTSIVELPNSVSDLENLTALLLGVCCSLKYVPPLGKLRALQELDLNLTAIEEVPEGVDRLVNLKYLNMECTGILEMLPSGTLSRLSQLQCLRFHCKSGPLEVQAEELEGLRELEEFTIRLYDVHGFNLFVKSLQRSGRQLKRYFLELRHSLYSWTLGDESEYIKDVKLWDCSIKRGRGGEGEDGILLPYDLQTLELGDCSFANCSCFCDVFPSLSSNARDLKDCSIRICEGLESVFSLSTEEADDDRGGGESRPVPFQSLERLVLYWLPDLRALFKSTELGFEAIAPPRVTFSSLKVLHISFCPQMKKLFTPRLLLQHLPNLEQVRVGSCHKMEEMVRVDDDERMETTSFFINNDHDTPPHMINLPKLWYLELWFLPELNSIWQGIMVCDSIKVISIWGCPKLKRLPFYLPLVNGQPSAPTALKQIEVYEDRNRVWWESLEWDHPNAKDVLAPFLSLLFEG